MQVLFDDIETFHREAGGWLLSNEAVNNVSIAVCNDIKSGRYASVDPLLIRVVDGSRLVTVAIQTPPYPLLLSPCAGDQAWKHLARALAVRGVSLPGVLGPTRGAHEFARAWTGERGVAATPGRQTRIFELTEVEWPERVPGQIMIASSAHRQLVKDWTVAFREEAIPDAPILVGQMLADADRRIDAGDFFVWATDDETVSMAALVSKTPHGRRLSYVYTPRHRRRQGFAGALVASLSQHVLETGCEVCFLTTDLSNPTSNRLYERIGYRAVADYQELGFSA